MTYPHGMITWTDLSSPDVPAARDFYSVLIGWEAEDLYHDNQLVYTMFRNDGKLAAGLGQHLER
jgi:predicted enzyme related to lactoylglutathione lyase